MKKLFTLLFILLSFQIGNAQIDLVQKLKGSVNPEELVSLSQSISFDQAIEVLNKVSEKVAGRKIVSTVNIKDPIGIEIDKMQYKKVLFIIVQYNNLIVDESGPSIVIKKKEEEAAIKMEKDKYASINEREVKISAVLFEANIDDMRQRGINWEFLFSQSGVKVGSKIVTLQEDQQQSSSASATTQQGKSPTFEVSDTSSFSLGKWAGSLGGILRFFETNSLGQIIARPIITVRNGVQGKTQVGDEFSIKEKDFAGNLVDRFYPTGTIIEVTPHVYTEDDINYVLLTISIERSSVVSRDALSTDVSKNKVNTQVLLLDGEETAIGGLFENQDIIIRRGIPFLKDLPWWVLGLRYLAGYDSKEVVRKEIIMLIKAELVPTLKERIQQKKNENYLKDFRKENAEEMNKYHEQVKEKDKEE